MPFIITGQIRQSESDIGVPNLRVEAWDKDLLFDDKLGECLTDTEGRLRIQYNEADFRDLFEKRPDIYLKVFAPDGTELHNTEKSVRCESGKEEHFDINIPKEKLMPKDRDPGNEAPSEGEFDFESDFGEGNLADPIPIEEFDDDELEDLKGEIDDFFFNKGKVKTPRGPITQSQPRPTPTGPVVNPPPPPPPPPPPGGGHPPPPPPPPPPPQQPAKPRVIPCDNDIIDESDGGNGRPPGGGPGGKDGPDIIEIPPRLKNCIFTQHHQADNGDGWTVIVRIQDGRMKQVVVIDENGNRTPVHRNVGQIIKVHKDNNKITVVGTRRVCTYFIRTNRLICVP